MKNLQFVISIIDCSHEGDFGDKCHFVVRVGLAQVGRVFKVPTKDWRFEDNPEHHERWVWEDDEAPDDLGSSLDTGASFPSRMEAVWALLLRQDVEPYAGVLQE